MADPADADPPGVTPAEEKPPRTPADTGPRRRRRLRRALVETGVIIAVAVLLAGLVRTFAFQTFWIPSASMVPTLGVYDRILVQKAFFTWRDVREGDIVVFSHPPLDHCPGPEKSDLVKRVIALPGQTIYSSGNSIYVNGRLLAEPYLPHYDPLGPPIREQPAPLPGAARRVLRAGRQPSGLMRQPLLGPDHRLEHHRQGRADVLAREPPRIPPVLTSRRATAKNPAPRSAATSAPSLIMTAPPVCGALPRDRCEQAEGAGLLDGLGTAARAELLVQVSLVRLDRVHR